MKRKIAIILCAALGIMTLSSCGKKEAEKPEAEKPAVTEEAEEEENAEGTSQENAIMLTLGEEVTGTIDDGSYVWYAFTTDNTLGTTYNITFVNATPETNALQGSLIDDAGTELNSDTSDNDGTAATINTNQLEADTTYYVRLNPTETDSLDYTLTVESLGDGTAAGQVGTAGSLSGDEIVPGSSQADAVLVPLGTKVFGTMKSDTYSWFAFTTGDVAETTYNITLINATPGTDTLFGTLCDEYGEELGEARAESDGTPDTIRAEELEPDTTYYVRLKMTTYDPQIVDYSLVVKDPNEKTTAYRTEGSLSEAKGTSVAEDGSAEAGTNPDNAAILPIGTQIAGTMDSDAYAWFGFTTGETQGAAYKITLVNTTAGSERIFGTLCNEYGEELGKVRAESDGTPDTISVEDLEPDTTYYIRLNMHTYDAQTVSYTLGVKSPEEKKTENTYVFETPFEINETQVQFVPDQAEFLDEAKAKEVLKPVAEAILAAPDHSVLIAGTTATDGDQASSVVLSEKRAEAVKELLTDTYNVPESQLETIGLGYELDPFERGKDIDGNGNFVESEAKKNRRVVILDIDDPIAQELLKNNK